MLFRWTAGIVLSIILRTPRGDMMSEREIINLVGEDDPILHSPVETFTEFGDVSASLQTLMINSLDRFQGLGLSANQIGISARVFSAIIEGDVLVAFNPSAIEVGLTVKKQEGCLSFPGLNLIVERAIGCRLIFQDHEGKWHERNLVGIDATCALHEIDHLNGVTFTKKVSRLQLSMQMKKRSKRSKA